jgi:hypothetical protein
MRRPFHVAAPLPLTAVAGTSTSTSAVSVSTSPYAWKTVTLSAPITVSTTANATSYTENGAATVIDGGILVGGSFASGNTLTVEFSAVGGAQGTVGLTEDELAITPGIAVLVTS